MFELRTRVATAGGYGWDERMPGVRGSMTWIDPVSFALGTLLMAISMRYIRGVDDHDAIPGIVVVLIALNLGLFVHDRIGTFGLDGLMAFVTMAVVIGIANRNFDIIEHEDT